MGMKLHKDAKTKGKIEFDDKKVITAKFRLSYPHLFEAKEFKGKSSYSCQMLFDKDTDLSELEVAAQNAAIEEWGSDPSKWPSKKIKSKKTGKIIHKSLVKMPFRDGDEEKPDSPEYEGMIFVGASCSKRAPEVLGRNRKPIEEDEIKAGDYCRAKLVASAYDVEGSYGVKFTLLAVQFLEEGEALGGGGSSAEEFDDGEFDDEPEDMEDENEDEDEEESEDEDEDEDEDEEEEEPVRKKSSKKTSTKRRR